MKVTSPSATEAPPSDFIRDIVRADLDAGRVARVVTRFPPEPNGHLHIGHAMAICLSHAIAREFDGVFHLRFDDTNPLTEDAEFVEGIQDIIRWLGCDWGENLFFASDYFEQLYQWALGLVDEGLAFVCDLSAQEIRNHAGSLTEPGRASPYRDRPVAENRDLFERMRAGEFESGSRVLRAKIDMASPVLTMRDPILYRIQKAPHHRTGDAWCIYPMYDFAHCLSDAIEGITHSLCSIEFVDHRPLYDWIVEHVPTGSTPRQYEFSRLNVSHTVTSKRKLRRLVEQGLVAGWDDPRMPSLIAQRRRGVRPESIRRFVMATGVTKRDKVVELARYEAQVREDLNERAPRVMGVLDPLKLVIENYPEGPGEAFALPRNPRDPSAGSRQVSFSRELWVERDDFLEDPPRKFFRLAPGREVRLRGAYLVTCTDLVKDESGRVVELRCRYDPDTRGGDAPDGRKVRGTIHWVSAAHALQAEVRLYNTLFSEAHPDAVADGEDFSSVLNPDSLEVRRDCFVEAGLSEAAAGEVFQFERLGYFCVDRDSSDRQLVFNRTVTLRDSWAKMAARSRPR
jgi:glutaminyl-tRNA synthetase